jgi:hypothetical protein
MKVGQRNNELHEPRNIFLIFFFDFTINSLRLKRDHSDVISSINNL